METAAVDHERPCPITPKEAENMTETLDEINKRLCKIERMMFAGRVALSVTVGIALAFGWVIDHLDSFKQGVINWLKD